jgi:hypothetical protein
MMGDADPLQARIVAGWWQCLRARRSAHGPLPPASNMKLSRLLGLACLCLQLVGTTWAQETCPHPENWRPTDEELQRIVSDNKKWAEKWTGEMLVTQWAAHDSAGRANLCNANLREVKLNGANLSAANLNNAYLGRAELNGASLWGAELNGASLIRTKLQGANLSVAKLNGALFYGADLSNADLTGAELKQASLSSTWLTGADLTEADLTDAIYDPIGVPDSRTTGIKGLNTVEIISGRESGLVQLRELLQKIGLRDLEREATFSIEFWRTKHAIFDWEENPGRAAEGIFRKIAFEWTTGYGLYPGRALKILATIWLLLIVVYFWPIRIAPKRVSAGGIYQIWPSDRIDTSRREVFLSKSANVNRLNRGSLAAFGYAAYFSLLSAFHIGWRDLNVGTWIARVQPREYALRATGWVRVVCGIQSLLSVYLLAIWALTYFGRPFQ